MALITPLPRQYVDLFVLQQPERLRRYRPSESAPLSRSLAIAGSWSSSHGVDWPCGSFRLSFYLALSLRLSALSRRFLRAFLVGGLSV